MPIPKSQYKNVSFYTGFSYLRPVLHGTVDAYRVDDPFFGTQYRVDQTIAIPANIVARPPYVRFFINTQGYYGEIEAASNIYVGNDSNNIRIYSDGNLHPVPYTIHYVIYDRSING